MAQVAATAAEQYFLELMNRARLNPTAEAALHGIDLNAGLAPGTLNTSQRQVLAINPFINQAADGHSNYLRSGNIFSHTGSGGSNAKGRMEAEGYSFTGSWSWGENIAWIGSSAALDVETAVEAMHRNLFLSVSHRPNTLNNTFREAGVGLSNIGSYQGYTNGIVATQKFALSGSSFFVTGVNYTDTDGDKFYSIGEGVGGRTVQLYQNGVAMSNMASTAAGGYSVATSGTGTIEARFSGGGLANSMGASFAMGGQNVKIDLVNGDTILSSHSATLTGAALNLTLLGINANSATGNGLNNKLTGNGAANSLSGLAGNDVFDAGTGVDTLNGGGGRDVATYAATRASASVAKNADGTWAITVGANGTDTASNVEVLQFSDRRLVIEDPLTDFNADANSDLLWFRQSDGFAYIWTLANNAQTGGTSFGQIGADWTAQVTGDFNGDGSSDFVWKNNVTGQFYIWNVANGVQSGGHGLGNIGANWDVVGSGDFNADGTGDILWRNEDDGHIYVYMMRNNALHASTSLGALGTEWQAAAVGDFNGDGSSDVALQRSTDGMLVIWDLVNGAVSDSFNFGALGNQWDVAGAGDFNSDGTDDLVLRNDTTGQLYLWMLENNQIEQSTNLGSIGADWIVDAVSDTNGDMTSDLVLQNNATGQFYIWNLANGLHSGSSNLGFIGTDWELI